MKKLIELVLALICVLSLVGCNNAEQEQRVILSNSVIDQTGGSVNVEGDLGKASGKGIIIGSKVKGIEELRDNLWFELKTIDLNGTETVYQIQITLTD